MLNSATKYGVPKTTKRCYGAPKIQKVLQNKGIKASIKRIQRKMKKLDIR